MKSTKPVTTENHQPRTLNKTLFSVVAVALGLMLADHAQAAAKSNKISSCPYTITASGAYAVTQDLTCSGTAITILADNVDLNLHGHTLSGDGSGAGVDVEGAANVNIHHGTVQGFGDGILLNGALNCKVSSVTASRNTTWGIALLNATWNTVTDNTTTETGAGNGTGIELSQSNGNTVTRNISDRNYLGINCADSSYGNTVTRNTATRNRGAGIRVFNFATQNTVQDNTCSGGNFIGIQLGGDGYPGANLNTIESNTANLNVFGILVELDYPANTGNTIQGNTALTNRDADLEDGNPDCDSNAWTNNEFVTDNVAGESDGGPGTGCIQ